MGSRHDGCSQGHRCGQGCPALAGSLYDLADGKGSEQYAEDLGRNLGLQPGNREARVRTTTVGDQTVGVIEYALDGTVKEGIQTTHGIEVIFEGQITRYHVDFSAPAARSKLLPSCSSKWLDSSTT